MSRLQAELLAAEELIENVNPVETTENKFFGFEKSVFPKTDTLTKSFLMQPLSGSVLLSFVWVFYGKWSNENLYYSFLTTK
jgi:hypothetical protein